MNLSNPFRLQTKTGHRWTVKGDVEVGAFSDFVREVLRSQVRRIEINTSLYSFPIEDPFGGKAGEPSVTMDALRPEIVLISSDGQRISFAPWGKPEEREIYVKGGATVAGLGILGILAYGYLRK